jgi:arylsulfatase A-like enzyme
VKRLRVLLVVALVAAALAACGGGSSGPDGEPGASRPPNIVFLLVDDLDQVVSPYWEAMPTARELLRDGGLTFENMFATDPVCCPARATLLTGMYPHNTRVYNSAGGIETFRTRASKWSIGVRMKAAGYSTAFIGKYLNGYELDPSYVPPGWDEWFGLAGRNFLSGYSYGANHNGTMEHFGLSNRDYQTEVLGRVATSFIDRRAPGDKPFLLTLFPSAPHSPIKPARPDRDNRFADDQLPDRPDFHDDLSDKPTWLREGYAPTPPKDQATALTQYRDGLGSLIAVDRMLASIVSHLKAAHELANTVFVFSSDNGFSFGSHQIVGKLVPYNETTRVPLVIAGPGIRHGTTDALAGAIDVAPTLYDLAGAPRHDDVDGTSLVPYLRDDAATSREDLLIEYKAPAALPFHTLADVREVTAGPPFDTLTVPDYRSVRTLRWQYIEWYAGPDHEYELYDMRADPYQLTNLFSDPATAAAHRDVVADLQSRLDALGACSGKTCR